MTESHVYDFTAVRETAVSGRLGGDVKAVHLAAIDAGEGVGRVVAAVPYPGVGVR